MDNRAVYARAGLLVLSSFALAFFFQIAWAWRHGMENFRSHVLIGWLIAALVMGSLWLIEKRKGENVFPVPLTSIWVGMSLFALCAYFGTKFERELALIVSVLSAGIYLLSVRACRTRQSRVTLVAAMTIALGAYLALRPITPMLLELDIEASPSTNRFWAYPVHSSGIDYEHPSVTDIPQTESEHSVVLRLRRSSAEYGIRFGGKANSVAVRAARLSVPFLLWRFSAVEYTAEQLRQFVSPPNANVTRLQMAGDRLSLIPGSPPNPAWLIVSLEQMWPSPAYALIGLKCYFLVGFVLLASMIAWRTDIAAGVRHIISGTGAAVPAVAAAWLFTAAALYVSYLLHPWYAGSIALVFVLLWWHTPWNVDRRSTTGCIQAVAQARPAWWPALLLFACLLAIVLRAPEIMRVPRFWAEDAIHYYYHAATLDAWSTFLYQNEYKLIISSIAALISRFFSLEWAPLPFTWIALAVQLATVAIVVYGNSPLWNSLIKKAIVVTIIIYAPSTEEIWLNANGTQYYSALITALLLCDDPDRYRPAHRHTVNVGLILCSLNGVLSSALAPLFWLRWLRERSGQRLAQAIILSLAGVIQLILVLTGDTPSGRTDLPSVGNVGWIFAIKGILQPLQLDWAYALFRVSTEDVEISQGLHLEAVGHGLLFACLTAVAATAYFLRCSDGLYLVLSLAILTVIVSLFGLGGEGNRTLTAPLAGNRYFYTSSVLMLLTVFACALEWLAGRRAHIATVATCGLLVMGIANSVAVFNSMSPSDPTWAQWQDEVALWRQDPSHSLRIWPGHWTLGLPPQAAR